MEKLAVGDFVYNDMVGFERKGYDFMDFVRMTSQVDELIDTYPFPFLVVEVSMNDIIKMAQKQFHRNMLPSILGITASLSVRGCPPIFYGTRTSMVIGMEKIAKKSLDGKERSMKRILRTRHLDAEDSTVNVLRGFGIGMTRAEDISEHYGGNLRAVLKVLMDNPKELVEVFGVGKGTVEKINKLLDGNNEESISETEIGLF